MKVIKKIIMFVISLMFLLAIASLATTYYLAHQNNLDFNTTDSSHPVMLGVNELNWNKDALNIKATVRINCVDEIIAGRYVVDNYEVTLLYYLDNPKSVTAECMHSRELNYKINNIPKGVYSATLQERSNIFTDMGA